MWKETNPYIIPMGVDTTLFFPAEGVQEKNDEIKLLYIWRLSYEKGVIDMLHSVIYCVNNWLNISCKIIWDWPLFEEMQKIIATKKWTLNKIELLWSKQNIELREFYQQADYFLFPSTKESFGITAVESILCWTPVLWNKSLPSTWIIIDWLNWILVYFNDKYELYQKLNESHYFDTTHVVSSWKKFSWENSSKKYSDILKTL